MTEKEHGVLRDGVVLSIGTLSALRVPPPSKVDPARAGLAMVLAPLAILPIALLAGAVAWYGFTRAEIDALVTGLLIVAVLALGTRAFHLDGLADLADGLTASHDPQRSLDVMKSGSVGPAGATALVLTLGLQAAGAAGLYQTNAPGLLVLVCVCTSRAALTVTCLTRVPPARDGGLASSFARTVPLVAAVTIWIAMTAALCGACSVAGFSPLRGVLTAALGLLTVVYVVRRSINRLGGVTGDVFGAAIEISLAVMLISLATSPEYAVEL